MSYTPENGELINSRFPEEPAVELLVGGRLVKLNHINTRVRTFDLEGGEFDHLLYLGIDGDSITTSYLFFKEFNPQDRLKFTKRLEDMKFPIKHQAELDELAIVLYSNYEASRLDGPDVLSF